MTRSDRLRERGPMERRLAVGIARSVPIGVGLFLILDFLALPTVMILAILGSLLAVGGFYFHLLAQARIADAVSQTDADRNPSHHQA